MTRSVVPAAKYSAFPPVTISDRQWPRQVITKPPIWCSVDLRDGNQALVEPMDGERKSRLFKTLVALGFKEIEVGFPAASQTDFDFVRRLIDEDMIPDDVTIQVLTQARDDLIDRTFDAIAGARRAIVHLYNSTSTLQRRVVFGLERQGIIDLAVRGAERIMMHTRELPAGTIVHQYSPESFTGTELDFARDICAAVTDVFDPTPARKMIVNLPSTVEMATPNVYADQIEWCHRNFKHRDAIVISVHPHNDRGTAVAAAELAVMAGAERIEGTLFGNGERTGNVCLVTLALNLFSQGVDPGLDFSDINAIRQTVEHCNRLPVHPRHPYGGDLVFTAFSGSHQDAIKKGFEVMARSNSKQWEVPYLPIDPADLGRSYEAIIRVNSQSGKGGIAYLLKADHGLDLPRGLQIEFSKTVQKITDTTGAEIGSVALWQSFEAEYLQRAKPFRFIGHVTVPRADAPGERDIEARIERDGAEQRITGSGNGPIAAYIDALGGASGQKLDVRDFREHARGHGADAAAVAYVELEFGDGSRLWGVGIDTNTVTASLKAVTSALNRKLNSTIDLLPSGEGASEASG